MFPLKDSIPSTRPAFVNWLLIAINCAVFFYEMRLPPDAIEAFVFNWGLVPKDFGLSGDTPAGLTLSTVLGAAASESPRVLSSMFLHGGIGHLLGNMLFLWIFGDNVEDRLGHGLYAVFYILCGIAASAVQVFSDLDSAVPIIGASGAIGGVMGAYMVSYPRARVLTAFIILIFVRLVWIPAVFYLGLWFALQLLSATSGSGGGVAFWAHVGGFGAGIAFLFPLLAIGALARKRRGR